jgi:hypothetical protein
VVSFSLFFYNNASPSCFLKKYYHILESPVITIKRMINYVLGWGTLGLKAAQANSHKAN